MPAKLRGGHCLSVEASAVSLFPRHACLFLKPAVFRAPLLPALPSRSLSLQLQTQRWSATGAETDESSWRRSGDIGKQQPRALVQPPGALNAFQASSLLEERATALANCNVRRELEERATALPNCNVRKEVLPAMTLVRSYTPRRGELSISRRRSEARLHKAVQELPYRR